MKLKPFVVATMISGLGLVGSAATAATNHSLTGQEGPVCRTPSPDYSSIVTGNSVVARNGFVNVGSTTSPLPLCTTAKEPEYDRPLAGVPLGIGLIANIDSYFSTKSKYDAGVPFFGDTSKSYADMAVRNVNLLLASDMGFVHGRVNLGFNDYSHNHSDGASDHRSAYGRHGVDLDEAYVSFYDDSFAFPAYAKVGRTYINYGDYDVYRMLPTLTQYLTEVNGTGTEIGFAVPAGDFAFYGNATLFGGPRTSTHSATPVGKKDRHPSNFSAKLGFQTSFPAGGLANVVKTQADVSYLHRVEDLSYLNLGTIPGFHLPGASLPASITGGSLFDGYSYYLNRAANNKSMSAVDAHLNFAMEGASLGGASLDVNFTSFLDKPWSVATGTAIHTPWALSADAAYMLPELPLPLVHGASIMLGGGISDNAEIYDMAKWEIHAGLGASITQNLSTQVMYQYNAKPSSSLSPIEDSNLFMMQLSLDV